MERYFNIAGPYIPEKHYTLPTLVRENDASGEVRALYCTLETLQETTVPAHEWSALTRPSTSSDCESNT